MGSYNTISLATATFDDTILQLAIWNPYATLDVPRWGNFRCKGINKNHEKCGYLTHPTQTFYDLIKECEQMEPQDLDDTMLREITRLCFCPGKHQKDEYQVQKLFKLMKRIIQHEISRLYKIHALEAENGNLERKLGRMTEKYEKKKIAHSRLEKRIRDSDNVWEEHMEASTEQLQEKEDVIDAQQQVIENIKLENESQGSFFSELLQTMGNEVMKKDAELRKCRDDYVKLEQLMERLRCQDVDKSNKHESEINRLKEELAEAKKTNETHLGTIDDLERAKTDLHAETRSLSDKLSQCQSDLQATQESLIASQQVVEAQREQLEEGADAETTLVEDVRELQEGLIEVKKENRMIMRSVQEKEAQLQAQLESQEAQVAAAASGEPQSKRRYSERVKTRLQAIRHSSGSRKAKGNEAVLSPEEA